MTLAGAHDLYNGIYDADDQNAPPFDEWLADSNIQLEEDLTPVAPPADPDPYGGGMTYREYVAYAIASGFYYGLSAEQLEAYQNWNWDNGPLPGWVLTHNQAAEDAAAAAAWELEKARILALLAEQPAEVRAMFDIGGEGYGSAYTIVSQANPGADYNDILAQAVTLQSAADAAGVLPSQVIAQSPDAAIVNTPIAPGTIAGPGPVAGTGAVGSRKKNGIVILGALALGAWWLKKRAA